MPSLAQRQNVKRKHPSELKGKKSKWQEKDKSLRTRPSEGKFPMWMISTAEIWRSVAPWIYRRLLQTQPRPYLFFLSWLSAADIQVQWEEFACLAAKSWKTATVSPAALRPTSGCGCCLMIPAVKTNKQESTAGRKERKKERNKQTDFQSAVPPVLSLLHIFHWGLLSDWTASFSPIKVRWIARTDI